MSDSSIGGSSIVGARAGIVPDATVFQGVSLWGRLNLEFEPGLEADFIRCQWLLRRVQFSFAWVVLSVWLLLLTIFGSLQISMDVR